MDFSKLRKSRKLKRVSRSSYRNLTASNPQLNENDMMFTFDATVKSCPWISWKMFTYSPTVAKFIYQKIQNGEPFSVRGIVGGTGTTMEVESANIAIIR